jgi:hypothetical protein
MRRVCLAALFLVVTACGDASVEGSSDAGGDRVDATPPAASVAEPRVLFAPPAGAETLAVARLDCLREVGPGDAGRQLVARLWRAITAEQAWITASLAELGIDAPTDLRELGFFAIGSEETIYVVAHMKKPDNTAAMLLAIARHRGGEPRLERTGDTDVVTFGKDVRVRATVRPIPGESGVHALFVSRSSDRGAFEIPPSEPASVEEIAEIVVDPAHACLLLRSDQVQTRFPITGASSPRLARVVLSLPPLASDDLAASAAGLAFSPTLTVKLDYDGRAPAQDVVQRWLQAQLAAPLEPVAGAVATFDATLVDEMAAAGLDVEGEATSVRATLSTRNVTASELHDLTTKAR